MTSGQRPRERDEKGGRDNGGDCTKESRCNPAARVVARETDRERGGGGCATPGTRAVETGFHSAGWNQRHLDTFSFSPVENNCPSRIWEIHRETNEQWMLFRARSSSSSSSPSSFLFRSFTCSDRKGVGVGE